MKKHSQLSYLNTKWLAKMLALVLLATGCAHHHSSDEKMTEEEKSLNTSEAVSTPQYNLVKTVPQEASMNKPLTFNYEVHSKNKLNEVMVHEEIPEGTEYISSSPSADKQGNTLKWDLGAMSAGERKQLEMKVQPVSAGEIKSCAYMTAIPVACPITTVGLAEVAIEKIGPETTKIGEEVSYTLKVSNSGTLTAKEVEVIDYVPSGMAHSSGKNTLSYSIGELKSGEVETVTLPLKANEAGEFVNKAKVESKNAGTDKAEAPITIMEPQLAISKSGPSEQFIAKQATYEIAVENPGDLDLQNLTVTDRVPEPLILVRAPGAAVDGNVATWEYSKLLKGETNKETIVVTTRKAGTYTNTATVNEAANQLSDDASATTTWKGYPALLIEVIDTVDPLIDAEETSFIITVTNQGTAADRDVQISATFPKELRPVSTGGTTSGTIDGQQVTFEPVAEIGAKEQVEFSVRVKAVGEGDARTKVQLKSDLLKKSLTEEESTQIY